MWGWWKWEWKLRIISGWKTLGPGTHIGSWGGNQPRNILGRKGRTGVGRWPPYNQTDSPRRNEKSTSACTNEIFCPFWILFTGFLVHWKRTGERNGGGSPERFCPLGAWSNPPDWIWEWINWGIFSGRLFQKDRKGQGSREALKSSEKFSVSYSQWLNFKHGYFIETSP